MKADNGVWVVGAGAIGSVIAGALRPEVPCLLIDSWEDNVDAIRAGGLRIEYPGGRADLAIPAVHTSGLADVEQIPTVILLAVKVQDTPAVLDLLLPHISEGTAVVSLQNGVNEEAIARIIGPERTIGAVVQFGAEMLEPGRVRAYGLEGGIQVGELDGALTPRLTWLAELADADFRVEITNDIWGALWSKLMVNVQVNALCALTGLATDELAHDQVLRRIALALAREAISVAGRLGIVLNPDMLDGDPSEYLDSADNTASLEVLEAKFVRCWDGLSVKPSMLQDVEKGRGTEIDALNGYVARKGSEVEVPVAVNEAVVGLIRSQQSQGQNREKLRAELQDVYATLVAD